MKQILAILALCSFSVMGQNRLWFSSGLQTTVLDKKVRLGASMSARVYSNTRWDKFFPEVSARYNLSEYFKPSLDYRYVINQQRNGHEITTGHRINLNFNGQYEVDRFELKMRVRFQYKFNSVLGGADNGYDADFDNAIRLKPALKYNIEGSKVDPLLESEWYYNTANSASGKQFTKYRFGIGVDIKLPNAHTLTLKYRYDYEFNIADPQRFHILSLEHEYSYKPKKSKGKKSRI